MSDVPAAVIEIPPSPILRTFVRSYHYTTMALGAATLAKPITARPEQMMQFSLGRPFLVVDRASGSREPAPDVVLVGRQTRRNFDLEASGDMRLLTVHFEPAGLYRLFHLPPRHLIDLAPDAADVVGDDARVLRDRLMTCGNVSSMIAHVERFLGGKVNASRPFHPVQAAARSMLERPASINIGTTASASQRSLRQFERLFLEHVGVRPKLFARIARFSAAVQSKSDHPDRSWAAIATDGGYFDQTHLVRDCRSLGDATPTELVQAWLACRP